MAKRKPKDEEAKDLTPAWEKALKQEIGDVFLSSNDIIGQERQIIPVSPAIDLEIGGGLISGTAALFSGIEKVGKTSMCLQIAANAQNLYNKKVYFGDVECKFHNIHLRSVSSLKVDEVTVIKSTKKNSR